MKEYYFSFNHIHKVIKETATDINRDNFKPDFILAVGAGGFVPARILRTFMEVKIITVTLSSYSDTEKKLVSKIIKEQWIDGVDIKNKKILVVDDIDDTRATIDYCVRQLLLENPAEIRLFILHNKIKSKRAEYPSEIKKIYVGENLPDGWINYPWEAQDIEAFDQMKE